MGYASGCLHTCNILTSICSNPDEFVVRQSVVDMWKICETQPMHAYFCALCSMNYCSAQIWGAIRRLSWEFHSYVNRVGHRMRGMETSFEKHKCIERFVLCMKDYVWAHRNIGFALSIKVQNCNHLCFSTYLMWWTSRFLQICINWCKYLHKHLKMALDISGNNAFSLTLPLTLLELQ